MIATNATYLGRAQGAEDRVTIKDFRQYQANMDKYRAKVEEDINTLEDEIIRLRGQMKTGTLTPEQEARLSRLEQGQQKNAADIERVGRTQEAQAATVQKFMEMTARGREEFAKPKPVSYPVRQ